MTSPALLYFVVAAGSLVAAHRGVRPLSARVALGLALLPLLFTGRALISGAIYAPIDLAYNSQPLAAAASELGVTGPRQGILSDLHRAVIPWRKAVRYAVKHGEWPLLDPFLYCGDPLAGSAQPAPLYPPNLLSFLLPLGPSLTFLAALQLFLAALSGFLFLRDLGCREETAFFGAAGWTFSSCLAFWLEWPLGAAISTLPLVLLGARRVARAPRPASAVLLGGALFLTVTAGHPESALHVVAVAAVWGLAELALQPRSTWPRAAGLALAAAAGAAGLAAVALLPILDTLPQTFEWALRRATLGGRAHGEAWTLVGKRLLPNLLPFVYGLPDGKVATGIHFFVPLSSSYGGSLLFAPALYAFWRGRGRARVLLGLLALGGLLAGAKMPGVTEALGRIPLFGLSLNERLVFVAAFALSGLAAVGLEACWRRKAWRELGSLTAGSTLVLALLLSALAPGMRAAGLGLGFLARQGLALLVPLALAAATLLCTNSPSSKTTKDASAPALPARHWRRLSPRFTVAILLAALLAQRALEIGGLYPLLPAAAFYPRVSPLDAMPAAETPFRVVGQGPVLSPGDAALYELEDPRGYQAIHYWRFLELLPLWAQRPGVSYTRVEDLSRPFLSFLNVRYAISADQRRTPGWRRVVRGPHSTLWRNPRALERAFLPRRVRTGVTAKQRLEEMAAETDFSSRAWIEPPAEASPGALPGGARGGSPDERENGRGQLRVERRGLKLQLTAELDSSAWIVISQVAWRGWRAFAGGRELPLGIANHAFLALELPAGRHEVDLVFRPRAFELGLAVSAATALLLTLAAAVAARRRWARNLSPRRGDTIAIPGDYQLRALERGLPPQRFWHAARLQASWKLLAVEPGARVLDAGCGSGLFAARAAAVPETTVLAVDANPAALAFARRTYPLPNLDFRAGLVDELDLTKASFHRIAFLEVLEHLPPDQGERAIAGFARLLAPGGRLLISTPNRRSPWPLLEWFLDASGLVPRLAGEQHAHLYAWSELEESARKAGLILVAGRTLHLFAPWAALFGDRAARAVARFEQPLLGRHGCLLLLAFEKPTAVSS